MKTLLLVFLSLASVFVFASTVFCDPNSDLIAYYALDGNAEDSGPSGFDGVGYGIGWSEDSVSGSALLLEGSGGFVDLLNHINFEYNQPFSISFWVKPAGIEKGIILSKREKSRQRTGWELRFNKKNHLVLKMSAVKKHNRIVARTKNAYIDLHEYYHVVITYDGSGIGSGIRFYVDGKSQPAHSKTVMLLNDSIQTDAHLNIGAKDNLAYKKQKQFKGLIDELSFHSAMLSAEDAKQLYLAFFGAGTSVDSDGDGIPDNRDQCPDTLPGLPVCADGCAASSCGVPGDTEPPHDVSLIINNGEAATSHSLVKVSLAAADNQGVAAYLVTEDINQPDPDHPGWVFVSPAADFSRNSAFVLTQGEGNKTLFAWFMDSSENISQPAESSIIVSLFRLPDTGQKLSYTISLGEDSDYTVHAPSFTNLNSDTVKDNNTSLIWQRKDDQVPKDHTTATAQCEGLVLGGYSDWRLPTVKELTSILDFSVAAPAVNSTYFSNTAANMGNYYWTSTVHPGDSDKFFNVDFRYGTVNALNASSRANFVRCVRGNQAVCNLTDNNDGTITDDITGLVWESGSAGPMNWESAIDHCENKAPINSKSWRLPNFKELEILRDNTRFDPSLDTNLFTDVASHYWSSTSYVSIPTLAYVSNLTGTIVSSYAGKMASYYVRCVQKK